MIAAALAVVFLSFLVGDWLMTRGNRNVLQEKLERRRRLRSKLRDEFTGSRTAPERHSGFGPTSSQR